MLASTCLYSIYAWLISVNTHGSCIKVLSEWNEDRFASLSWSVHISLLPKPANDYINFMKQLKRAGVPPQQLLHFYVTVIPPVLEYCTPVWMPSLDRRLNSWSRYKSALFTLFMLLLGACHILICSSLNLPPLNPGTTNIQGHSFKISVTHSLPSIIYFPPLRDTSVLSRLRTATRFSRTKILLHFA